MHSLPQRNPIATTPIRVKGRSVGYVDDGVFHKTVSGSRHFLRTPRAIAFDQSTLRDAAAAGASDVRVLDREKHDVYCTTLEEIRLLGFAVTRGYGSQWALALDYWSINGCYPRASVRAADSNKGIKALQPALLEVAE